MTRRSRNASMIHKIERARRDRALIRPELGTNGGTHTDLRPVGLWSSVKVVDEKTRKLIDEAIRLRRQHP